MSRLVIILIVALGLVVIAVLALVIPRETDVQEPVVEPPQPIVTQVELPQPIVTPVELPQPTEPPQPVETPSHENALIFSERELQDKVEELIDMVNQAGSAKIEYIKVRLEQDKMLVSAKGEALGNQVETEDMEVRFEERTVFASGKVSAFGFTPTLTAEVDIICEAGKPSVDIKTFNLGALPLMMFNLSRAKISGIINDAIESRGMRLPYDLDSIRIEDGKLIVVFQQGSTDHE